jgi:hypothetical protein
VKPSCSSNVFARKRAKSLALGKHLTAGLGSQFNKLNEERKMKNRTRGGAPCEGRSRGCPTHSRGTQLCSRVLYKCRPLRSRDLHIHLTNGSFLIFISVGLKHFSRSFQHLLRHPPGRYVLMARLVLPRGRFILSSLGAGRTSSSLRSRLQCFRRTPATGASAPSQEGFISTEDIRSY